MNSFRSASSALFPLLFAVTASASAAACSTQTVTKATQTAPTEPAPASDEPVAPSATPPLSDTINPKIVSTLKAAGVDVTKPGDLENILDSQGKLKALMTSFTIALGTTCTGCHASVGGEVDYEAETPRKNVTKKMWSQFVQGLTKKDGGAIFCDSCHQGKMEFLDRADPRSLTAWMTENFVGKLARADGADHTCATCHGEPFNDEILAGWSK